MQCAILVISIYTHTDVILYISVFTCPYSCVTVFVVSFLI